MRRSRCLPIFASLVFVLLFAVLNVRAADEGGNAAEGATQLFKWINTAIVVGLLIWVCAKYGSPFFRKKAETISATIGKSTEIKAEAQRQLREAESKLARLQEEVASLRATAQREAVAEAERIRNVTRMDVERVGLAAKAEIEAAERAARLRLKVLAADLAVKGAEDLLAEELTPKTQQVLVNSFVQSLEGSPN